MFDEWPKPFIKHWCSSCNNTFYVVYNPHFCVSWHVSLWDETNLTNPPTKLKHDVICLRLPGLPEHPNCTRPDLAPWALLLYTLWRPLWTRRLEACALISNYRPKLVLQTADDVMNVFLQYVIPSQVSWRRMESHTVARTSTTSSLPSAQAVGSQWGRTTWLQPMAPGIQSASSVQWASYLRPHTQLWLAYRQGNKWERYPHICFICNILTTRLMKTVCRCGGNDANKSRQPYSSVWISFTFSSDLLLMQHLVTNGSVSSSARASLGHEQLFNIKSFQWRCSDTCWNVQRLKIFYGP